MAIHDEGARDDRRRPRSRGPRAPRRGDGLHRGRRGRARTSRGSSTAACSRRASRSATCAAPASGATRPWTGAPRSRRTRRTRGCAGRTGRRSRACAARGARRRPRPSARLRRAAGRRAAVRGGGLPAARRDPATPRRPAGAEAAYTKAHEFGEDPQPGLALLRLAQGKRAAARAAIAAALGAAGPARPHQVRLHAANVEIALADGAIDDARASAEELGRIAEETRAPAFAAQAAQAAGAVALATGDVDGALARLREACTAWQELRLPYEASRARVGFARGARRRRGRGGRDARAPRRARGLRAAGSGARRRRGRGTPGDARRACRPDSPRERPRSCACSRRARRTATSRWSS